RQNNTDIYLTDVERKTTTRLTYDSAVDALPIWSPDGSRLFFNSSRTGGSALYVQPTDSQIATQLHAARTGEVQTACDWSPDGRSVRFRGLDASRGYHDL